MSEQRLSRHANKMLLLIIRLHREGLISEGQVAEATGLSRIEIRRIDGAPTSQPDRIASA